MPSTAPLAENALMLSAGKYANNAVLAAFQMIGGVERLATWADEEPTKFYTSLFSKLMTREVEITDTRSIEDVIFALDSTPTHTVNQIPSVNLTPQTAQVSPAEMLERVGGSLQTQDWLASLDANH